MSNENDEYLYESRLATLVDIAIQRDQQRLLMRPLIPIDGFNAGMFDAIKEQLTQEIKKSPKARQLPQKHNDDYVYLFDQLAQARGCSSLNELEQKIQSKLDILNTHDMDISEEDHQSTASWSDERNSTPEDDPFEDFSIEVEYDEPIGKPADSHIKSKQADPPKPSDTGSSAEDINQTIKENKQQRDLHIRDVAKGMWNSKKKHENIKKITNHIEAGKPFSDLDKKVVASGKKAERSFDLAETYQRHVDRAEKGLESISQQSPPIGLKN